MYIKNENSSNTFDGVSNGVFNGLSNVLSKNKEELNTHAFSLNIQKYINCGFHQVVVSPENKVYLVDTKTSMDNELNQSAYLARTDLEESKEIEYTGYGKYELKKHPEIFTKLVDDTFTTKLVYLFKLITSSLYVTSLYFYSRFINKFTKTH